MGGVVMNGPYHGRTLSGVDQGAASASSSSAATIATKLSAAKFVLAISEYGVATAGTTPARSSSRSKLVLSNKLAISDMSTMTLASLRERLLIYARV
ncbi:hypothetical protein PG997_015158 [Apiospora hydei]|uniref:Uncharacterized protein n=1 Tax=Apiospora hydei TaxID=1337664 RepID=A0ABR1UVU2_9PEZI